MPTISSASMRLVTTATDTVAPSTISTPLLLLLPHGRYWHHGRTLGGSSHPWRTLAGRLVAPVQPWPGPLQLVGDGEADRLAVRADPRRRPFGERAAQGDHALPGLSLGEPRPLFDPDVDM